jgi:hypothetical protein
MPAADYSSSKFQWRTNFLDAEVSDDARCDWTWDISPDELKTLLEFLSDLSQLEWSEIEASQTGSGRNRHCKHHAQPITSLCHPAQVRLAQVLDESYSELFRFRYGGTERIWGVRDRAIFYPIWLDLKHQVYPTEKD